MPAQSIIPIHKFDSSEAVTANVESPAVTKLENLRREIAVGVAQADACDFAEFVAEQIINEGTARRAFVANA
jgi:hypothetical protein